MKRRVLKKEVKVVLGVIGLVAFGCIMRAMPDDTFHEVRTMYVYDTTDELTLLVDGNDEIYGMYDKVYDTHKPLLVTIDTRGTKNLRDDVIVSWVYRNW
jgi:hypothetical protein